MCLEKRSRSASVILRMTSEPASTCSWMRSSLACRCSASRSRCVLDGMLTAVPANGAGHATWPAPKARSAADFPLHGGLALLDALLALDVLPADEAAVVETLAVVGELVVGQAALVHPRTRLVQLGLRALAGGDLLGLLGTRGAGRRVLTMGVGDLAALTSQLAL